MAQPLPKSDAPEKDKLFKEIDISGKDKMNQLFGWWFKLVMPPKANGTSDFIKRDADQRSRMLSLIGLVLLASNLINAPVAIFGGIYLVYLYISAWILTLLMLVFNRLGYITLAACTIVAMIEILCMMLITSNSHPLTAMDLLSYSLFILGELFAVSLLPLWTVFFIAFINIVFIYGDYLIQPHSVLLDRGLEGFNTLMVTAFPVCIQVSVAGIASLWVYTAAQAAKRANHAEFIAQMEHFSSEQRATAEQEKLSLEADIQALIQAHIATSNGQMQERIPYPSAQILWPVVGVLNSLWMRLRTAQNTEKELQHLQEAINAYEKTITRASHTPDQQYQSFPLTHTGTLLDPLILALKTTQEIWDKRRSISKNTD